MSTETQWRLVGERKGAPWAGAWSTGEPSNNSKGEWREVARIPGQIDPDFSDEPTQEGTS